MVAEPVSVEEDTVAAAVTVTDVGVVPDVMVDVATPLVFVVAEAGEIVAASLLNEKPTVAPETGLFELSLTVADIVVELEVDMVEELAETVILPVLETCVIVIVVEPVRVDAVAVAVTVAGEVTAVRVTVAMPLEFVTAVELDRDAAVLSSEKLTVTPETRLFEPSLTVAVNVDVPEEDTDEGSDESVRLPPLIPPVMVIVMVPVMVSEVAVIVTVPLAVNDAVKVIEASPLLVKAPELERDPFEGVSRVKESDVPSATALPEPSTTRAVMVDVPDTDTEEGLAVSVIAEMEEAVTVIFT